MVDFTAKGAEGAPFRFDVEYGKLREFVRAIATDDPAYSEGARPVVPPTFLTSMFHWERDVPDSNPWPRVEMSQKRGVHAEQEYVFHGPPPRAGDQLTARSRIDEIWEKEGRRGGTLVFVTMVTEFRDGGGELVAEAKMTAVETAKPPEEAP
jgi:hypothetical protein